jgi:REP element-mobilizing transposase RayT
MPTHLHLVTSTDDGVNFPGLMRDFKHFTASKIITILEEERHTTYLRILEDNATKRAPEQQHKVWQDGYHPVALTSERWFEQKLDYMHNNPVRKGFVEYPEHWKYSSARNWLEDDHSIIEIDKNA